MSLDDKLDLITDRCLLPAITSINLLARYNTGFTNELMNFIIIDQARHMITLNFIVIHTGKT